MSYYKVRTIDTRDINNLYVTVADSSLYPLVYKRVKYKGNIKDLFKNLLSGALQITPGNRQKVNAAFLQTLLYLKSENISTYDLYKKKYECKHFDKAYQIFREVLDNEANNSRFYIKIDGNKFYKWTKRGYKYTFYSHTSATFIDLLRAQLNYDDVVYEEI